MNQFFLTGNVGKKPDLRRTANSCVVNFSIAETVRSKNSETGEFEKKTTWHSCVAFGMTGEHIEKYVEKGDKLLVSGRIVIDSWTDKEGVKKYTTKVIVSDFELMVKRPAASESEDGRISTLNSEKPKAIRQVSSETGFDDDIPF